MNIHKEKKNITIEQADIIWAEIEKAQSILMHCHPNPDGDSLGSTLGLAHALRSKGKKVTVIKGDSDLPAYLSALPGYSDIVKKNYFETDLEDFDVFLILDAAALGQISRIQEVVFPENLTTIVIDHHKTNPGFADINLIEPAYPAACQIVYRLLKQWNIPIHHDTAICLFVGIFTDTGGFAYSSTTSSTFDVAADLTKIAPDFTDVIFSLRNANTPGRLKLDGLMLSSIQVFFNNSVAMASVSYASLNKEGINPGDVAGNNTADILKSVVGWNIGMSLIEAKEGKIKCSFRTRDPQKYDVSKLAEALGGGGHAGAAGAQILATLEEAKEQVLAEIRQIFPDIAE